MLNANKLKGKIVERGMTVSKLASLVGMDPGTLYRKINETTSFTINEVDKITSELNLSTSEAMDIFFSH